jgi:hypothetical protein
VAHRRRQGRHLGGQAPATTTIPRNNGLGASHASRGRGWLAPLLARAMRQGTWASKRYEHDPRETSSPTGGMLGHNGLSDKQRQERHGSGCPSLTYKSFFFYPRDHEPDGGGETTFCNRIEFQFPVRIPVSDPCEKLQY